MENPGLPLLHGDAGDHGQRSICDLLSAQLELVQKALEFNVLISTRLREAEASPRRGNLPRCRKQRFAESSSLPCHYIGDDDSSAPESEAPVHVDASTRSDPMIPKPMKSEKSMKSNARASMFGDRLVMKSLLSRTLTAKENQVEQLYKERGFWREVTKHPIFFNTTFFVLVLNIGYIAIETDMNKAEVLPDADPVYQIIDNCFCCYFFFEVFARLMSFKSKRQSYRDSWFRFDFLLVVSMIWETWIVSLVYMLMSSERWSAFRSSILFGSLKFFRVLRACRVVRLVRLSPELMIFTQAIVGGMRSVVGTIALLLLVIYAFALVFTQLLADQHAMDGIFDTFPESLNTLMKNGVFPDQQDILDKMLSLGPLYYLIFVLYLIIGVLTVMNLLTGVLVEVVGEVAKVEKVALLRSEIRHKLLDICPLISLGDSDTEDMSRHEFREFITNPCVLLLLADHQVAVQALVDHMEFLFSKDREIPVDNFVDLVLEFRGGAVAKVKHIDDIQRALANVVGDGDL
eukprot:TRINITY_DN62114_c0_g1_i1.p1 TRINITY_DN62114_c0_g1~~TRINITY_DN62114_c0_g1_i1.p1  ORF type:complete len:533 (-),score=63.90 TRINITY_DN62114_c0_g1_i1:47-1597(-)